MALFSVGELLVILAAVGGFGLLPEPWSSATGVAIRTTVPVLLLASGAPRPPPRGIVTPMPTAVVRPPSPLPPKK